MPETRSKIAGEEISEQENKLAATLHRKPRQPVAKQGSEIFSVMWKRPHKIRNIPVSTHKSVKCLVMSVTLSMNKIYVCQDLPIKRGFFFEKVQHQEFIF